MKFRSLKPNEIEVFPKMIKENGCMVLLYKDARCDMNILDETVGCMGWKREHTVVNNNLFCTVSIYDKEKKEWISKQDVGVESFTEKVKGQASDSFKRACFNWGIGRELYTTPFIWISLNKGETYSIKQNGKTKWNLDRSLSFKVNKITTIDGRITELEIADQNETRRFKWNLESGNKSSNTISNQGQENSRETKIKRIYALAKKLGGFDKKTMDEKVKEQYKKSEVKFLKSNELEEVLNKWEQFESKKAK